MSSRRRVSISSVRSAFQTIVWPRRFRLLLGLLLICVNRLSSLVLPQASKVLIDDVIGAERTDLLRGLLFLVGAAFLVQAGTSFALTRVLSVEAQHLISELRSQIQKHLVRLPIGYFDRHKSGELVSRVMTDVEGVRNLVGTGLVQLVGGILTAIVVFFILIRISPSLTAVALIPLVLFAAIAMQAFKRIRPIFRARNQIRAEVTGRLTETLGGVRVVKGFGAEAREEEVFEEGVDRLFQNVKKTLTAQALVTSLSTFLFGVASVAVMGLGGLLIQEGSMSVGDFFAFTLYLGLLVAPVLQLASIGTQLTEAFAGLDRMEEVLSEPREEDDPERKIVLDRVEGRFRFEEVSFSYDEDQRVLEAISFEAEPGSVTALVGSSGSGKSTLAGLAASFLTPESGRIEVDGHDLARVKLASYRSQLGLVLQEDFLFDGTIRENLSFARPEATDAEIASVIETAHVAEFTDRFEKGLDTVIGERGVKLSGGQRQRVAIARALLANPRVLILDEATSNLDTESERYIQESFEHLMQNRTTFVIAHRLSTIQRADQILVLEEGRIVESGNHESLIAAQGRYYQLYTYQARI